MPAFPKAIHETGHYAPDVAASASNLSKESSHDLYTLL